MAKTVKPIADRPDPETIGQISDTGRSLNELLDKALHLLLERRGRQLTRKGPSHGDV